MERLLGVPGAARRRLGALAASVLTAALLVGVMATPALALIFSNLGTITINDNAQASPYPSQIAVSGTSGTITDVNVSLFGYTHGFPDDVDVLLVGPGGQTVVLMADVCGGGPGVSGVNLTFDDGAVGSLPASGCTSGVYDPTNGGGFSGTPPAPGGPYGATLSVFNGLSANGTWSLYVFDDAALQAGSISSGWNLDITGLTTGPTITSFTPTSGPIGTVVTITGTNLTGATSVTFGGVAATTFTVNSATQITATVPTGAVTGTISVTTSTGTGTSASSFTVIPVPTITSFAPAKGQVGDAVVITGTNFTGATSVKFGGVTGSFTFNSATQITATVPSGAVTGPISVTTPGGTATSATTFVVSHERTVNLNLTAKKAKGTVTVSDGFAACASFVTVKVQHLVNGDWKAVATDTTGSSGAYSVGGVGDPGKYRAVAKKLTVGSGDVCLKDISNTQKH